MKRFSSKEVLFVLTLAVVLFVMSMPAMAVDPGRYNPLSPIIRAGEHSWGGDQRGDNPWGGDQRTTSVVPTVDNQLDQNDEVVPLFSPPWQGRYNPLLPYIIFTEIGWHEGTH